MRNPFQALTKKAFCGIILMFQKVLCTSGQEVSSSFSLLLDYQCLEGTMKDVVLKEETLRLRRNDKSTFFCLCDLMCEGLEIADDQEGIAPLPICLMGEEDHPVLMYWNDSIFLYWNFWRCFISTLKKGLSEILTSEELKMTRGNMLFSLFFEYETGSHTFSVHKEWVAQRLGIRPQTNFYAGNSTEAFVKLRSLCFKETQKRPIAHGLLQLTAAKESLPFPQRCELNLILASLANKMPTRTANR